MKPKFFKDPPAMREWFQANHNRAGELLVGFYKRKTGKASVTWRQSVDEALCFGWIDGIRKSVDETCYTIRFTPRRPRSIWSAVNIRRVEELIKLGKMSPTGLAAFELRQEERSRVYSFERDEASLDGEYERQLRANNAAWSFWDSQPPSYRKAASWWVVSAKKDETRKRRLEQLIKYSAASERIPQYTWKKAQ